jgi:regulatory protein
LADSDAAARSAAYRLLARAPRSAAEVAEHLRACGFSPQAIRKTLQALGDLRYIDDAALAGRRAEELLLRRGYGRLRVVSELTRRGLADSVIATAIAKILESQSEAELARKALRRRLRGNEPASYAERARAYRFLVGRGHPEAVVSEILGEDD